MQLVIKFLKLMNNQNRNRKAKIHTCYLDIHIIHASKICAKQLIQDIAGVILQANLN